MLRSFARCDHIQPSVALFTRARSGQWRVPVWPVPSQSGIYLVCRTGKALFSAAPPPPPPRPTTTHYLPYVRLTLFPLLTHPLHPRTLKSSVVCIWASPSLPPPNPPPQSKRNLAHPTSWVTTRMRTCLFPTPLPMMNNF